MAVQRFKNGEISENTMVVVSDKVLERFPGLPIVTQLNFSVENRKI